MEGAVSPLSTRFGTYRLMDVGEVPLVGEGGEGTTLCRVAWLVF